MVVMLLFLASTLAQRRLPQDEDASNSAPCSSLTCVDTSQWPNAGEFPFQRGETAIFNFDEGDEGFILTIPDLITGLNSVREVVHKQRKITQAFGEAFASCEACG